MHNIIFHNDQFFFILTISYIAAKPKYSMNTVLKRGRGDCFRYIPTMLRAKYEVGQTARLHATTTFFMVF